MASQKGAIRYTGKFANTVGFKNTASMKKNNFFIREHVDEVANPRTRKQSTQRAKARPAQIFYQAFEGILNHAYIPLGRASRNRNRFLSFAMKLPDIPDVPKGAAFIPSVPYQISEGNLGIDSLTLTADSSSSVMENLANDVVGFPALLSTMTSSILIADDENETIGNISSAILGATPLLENGEELTFLVVLANKSDVTQRVSAFCSFVLNTEDQVTKALDVASSLFEIIADNGGHLFVYAKDPNWAILSTGVIISAKAGRNWRYTNSHMGLSTYAKENTAFTEQEVLESYETAGKDVESDKILQQADNEAQSGTVTVKSVDNVAFETSVQGTRNYETAAVATMSDGSRRVVVGAGFQRSNAIWHKIKKGSYVTVVVTGTEQPAIITELAPSMTTFGGSPTISMDEITEAGF